MDRDALSRNQAQQEADGDGALFQPLDRTGEIVGGSICLAAGLAFAVPAFVVLYRLIEALGEPGAEVLSRSLLIGLLAFVAIPFLVLAFRMLFGIRRKDLRLPSSDFGFLAFVVSLLCLGGLYGIWIMPKESFEHMAILAQLAAGVVLGASFVFLMLRKRGQRRSEKADSAN